MIKAIISRLTMIKTKIAFYDHIEKKNVYVWQDCYFNSYLANNRLGIRIKIVRIKIWKNK